MSLRFPRKLSRPKKKYQSDITVFYFSRGYYIKKKNLFKRTIFSRVRRFTRIYTDNELCLKRPPGILLAPLCLSYAFITRVLLYTVFKTNTTAIRYAVRGGTRVLVRQRFGTYLIKPAVIDFCTKSSQRLR